MILQQRAWDQKYYVKDENFYTAMRNLVLHSDPKIPIDSGE